MSSLLRFLSVAALVAIVVVGLTALRIRAAVTPPDPTPAGLDLAAMGLLVEEVSFAAADGLELSAWQVPGAQGLPTVVLCHDWGDTRESLIPLALELSHRRFPLLMFDFRGHGRSQGGFSTLGAEEARDVLGALDYARRMQGDGREGLGLYGVGMGAHAAVLAASERPAVRVVVLDGLYPDPGYELVRRFYGGWRSGMPRAEFLPVGVFSVMTGVDARADRVVGGLVGRDLLFLAPEMDRPLAAEIERMYRMVPEQRDVDPNLMARPGGSEDALYGEAVEVHRAIVGDFFSSRLLRPAGLPG